MKKLIALEGIDGAGKTSCLKRFEEEYFETQWFHNNFWLSKEPFNVRLDYQHLLDDYVISPFMYAADRANHLEFLKVAGQNCTVITDRYKYSSMAYQTAYTVEEIAQINAPFPDADLIIYFNVLPEIAKDRSGDVRSLESFAEIKWRYEDAFSFWHHREVKTINANRPFDEVYAEFKSIILEEIEDDNT